MLSEIKNVRNLEESEIFPDLIVFYEYFSGSISSFHRHFLISQIFSANDIDRNSIKSDFTDILLLDCLFLLLSFAKDRKCQKYPSKWQYFE